MSELVIMIVSPFIFGVDQQNLLISLSWGYDPEMLNRVIDRLQIDYNQIM